jgi:hypothetical protein
MERYAWRYSFVSKNIFTYLLLILLYIGDFENGISKITAFLNSRNAKGNLVITNPVLEEN